MQRNKLAEVESRYNLKRKKEDGCLAKKLIEAEMIKCFELALYQSCESKMKKKQFTEEFYITPVCM